LSPEAFRRLSACRSVGFDVRGAIFGYYIAKIETPCIGGTPIMGAECSSWHRQARMRIAKPTSRRLECAVPRLAV